ncbi:conserved virulence factor C family protein [Saliterribacillus persicus]|uniref:HEAT repeat protein n=1 Tax=Saliterribacillus persicus TaxID=930114 RepID=A0A368XGP4_9BACI|nr:conserved virulence factor C family protein [Saliterribacillus persicus]RCW67005.1 HEAT repeat protein [Saliterribacillus persicus]
MKIFSIEPTPSPHSMKINLDETLPMDTRLNFSIKDNLDDAPAYIQSLFQIDGVKNIYQVVDFIALEKNAKVPWETILPKVREQLGTVENIEVAEKNTENETTGSSSEVQVFVQYFREIPMQLKLIVNEDEERLALPERFNKAVMEASVDAPNFVMERKWIEMQRRYGMLAEVKTELLDEIDASYDEKRIQELVELAQNHSASDKISNEKEKVDLADLEHRDWKVRYRVLDQMDPTMQDLPLLAKAIKDEKASIRRLATAYLGMLESRDVLPYLYEALTDPAVTVRRTAGDCISDLGYMEAMPQMIASLKDSNRLVRWRAAMFLYEIGDESAVPALELASNDPEFEVKMQVKMALSRINDGEKAKGSVWHQMTQATSKNQGGI